MGLLEDAIREHLELKRRHGANADEVARAERDALGPPGRPSPLEDTATAHAAELTSSAREAPEPGDELEPFDLDEDDLDEPAAVLDDEPLEAESPTRAYEDDPFEEEPELFAEEEAEPFAQEEASPSTPEPEPSMSAAAHPPLEADPPPPQPDSGPLSPEAELVPPPVEPEAEIAHAQPEAELAPVPPEAAPDAPTRISPSPDLEEEPPAEQTGGEEAATGAIEGEDVLEETPDFLQETPEHDRLWFEQKPPRDFDFGS